MTAGRTAAQPARRQMPAWLERFDDDRGLVWRSYNAVRGIDPRRTARFVQSWIGGPSFERPVFVIGTPRSGTTLLFRMLSRHPDLASLGHEGHDIWRFFHHPRKRGWSSDVIDAAQARPATERRFAEAFIRARTQQAKPAARRFIEKTPDNALRTEYILRVFPDARFVAIHRHPCRVVSSFIDGWNDPDGRFRAYYLPETLSIPGYGHERRWCFTLIPGWRDLISSPVPEIAVRQWEAYVTALAAARERLPAERFIEIHLEDLSRAPEETLRMLAEGLDLQFGAEILDGMAALARTRVNAFGNGAGDGTGWMERNGAALRPLLPRIAALAPRIGYEVDPETGGAARI